jgi:nucleotide-binding universal stress UspA family protein
MLQSHILVPLSSQPNDGEILQQASAIGALINCQARACLAQSDPADVMLWTAEGTYSGISTNLVEAAWAGAEEAWTRTQEHVAALRTNNHPLNVERIIGPIIANLVKRAALADLSVFSCENARGKGLLSNVLEALVMDAHAPTIVVRAPAANLAKNIKAGVMIAWNGSVEAARAAKAALPFLRATDKVWIAQVGAHEDNIRNAFHAPSFLRDDLAARGIAAEIVQLDGADAPKAILDAAKVHRVGLLVAGAWGHSRAREFVFGGATRSFLKDASSPSLLLCH